MTTKVKNLVKAYKKYIDFLSNSYADVFTIAHAHGYQCSEEDFEMGEKLRNAIKELENECAVPDNDVLMDYLY
jgi:hemoglobin-like flavoprotein